VFFVVYVGFLIEMEGLSLVTALIDYFLRFLDSLEKDLLLFLELCDTFQLFLPFDLFLFLFFSKLYFLLLLGLSYNLRSLCKFGFQLVCLLLHFFFPSSTEITESFFEIFQQFISLM